MKRSRLLELDAQLSARMRIVDNPGIQRAVAVFLAHSGDSWFWILGLALLWWQGNADWEYRAKAMAFGVVITAVVVMAIKFTVRRRRPEGEWGGIYRNTDPHSFPSGHAARAAMLATMAIGLGPVGLSIGLTVWAPLVGLARIALGVHYLSDVLGGFVIGIVLGIVAFFVSPAWIQF